MTRQPGTTPTRDSWETEAGRRGLRTIGDVIVGAAAGTLVFGAVPAVLVGLIGEPWPHRFTTGSVLSARGAFDLLAILAWISWAACCWSLLRAVAARVRYRDTDAGAGAQIADRMAARIAAAVLVAAPVGISVGSAAGAVSPRALTALNRPARTHAPRDEAIELRTDDASRPPKVATCLAVSPVASTRATCTVEPGDTLWSMAERHFDDGTSWSQIAAANLGREMSAGEHFVDPSAVHAGWVLELPDLAIHADYPGGTGQAMPESHALPRVLAARPEGSPRGSPRGGPPPVELPELVALGVGALVAGVFARQARRVRARGAMIRRLRGPRPEIEARTADVGALVAPFERMPALDSLEAANRDLTRALVASGSVDRAPPIALVRVTARGVEMQLARPVRWAPPGWELADAGRCWRRRPARGNSIQRSPSSSPDPWVPTLLPIGDNEEGSWLVPVEPGTCLPVLGPATEALVAAMRLATANWPWSDLLTVTDDPAVAQRWASSAAPAEAVIERARLVFFGDPTALSPTTGSACGTVTTLPLPATSVTVTVDENAASLHPLGITLRPNLLDRARSAAIAGMLEAREERAPVGTNCHRRPAPKRAAPQHISNPLEPGVVEVRLLTPKPVLMGLTAPMDPKRARRATELVAYLAVHHPDPVTGDRLRTRVLGSADADAAAKTLFNVAHAARAAMGRDNNGEPLLPPATRSSEYRVAPVVTADTCRAERLVTCAKDGEDPDEAAVLLQRALELVEGEPLTGALAGYGWWGAEGHEARVGAALVEGACHLTALALEGGHLDLARWAIERARLVNPYSEALTVAAMQVAARAGDPDGLRREWTDCLRWVDELAPGDTPSMTTERCYVELRRRMPSIAGAEADR